MAAAATESALALGASAARAIRSMEGADEVAAKAIQARWIVRNAVLQLPGVGASLVAIAFIFVR